MTGGRFWLGGLLAVSGFLLLAGVAEASLFCVVDFAGKRCQYADLDTCRRAAGKQGGCVLNEAEIAKPFGNAPFCLVESWRTECVYYDMASCEKRASTTRTVCMPNAGLANAGSAGGSPSTLGNMPAMGGGSPFGGAQQMPGMPQMPQAAMPGLPGGRPTGLPGTATLPSSGGIGATGGYAPNIGYWPGIDK